jgi:hypothetical protein
VKHALVILPVVAFLAFAPAVPVLSPILCLVALLALGSLWVRALIREPLTPVAALGLSVVAGLISLPLVALALYAVGLHIERRGLAAGLAVLALLLGGLETLLAHATHPGHGVGRVEHGGTTETRPLSTALAVGVPAALALLIGGTATVVYQRLPHPAEPGYTSLALAGWAAGIARPVAIPRKGVEVPLEVSSAGEPATTATLQIQIGGRVAGPGMPIPITSGTRTLKVHIPAPTDGCLRPIRISLGAASTVFYGRGPFPC